MSGARQQDLDDLTVSRRAERHTDQIDGATRIRIRYRSRPARSTRYGARSRTRARCASIRIRKRGKVRGERKTTPIAIAGRLESVERDRLFGDVEKVVDTRQTIGVRRRQFGIVCYQIGVC